MKKRPGTESLVKRMHAIYSLLPKRDGYWAKAKISLRITVQYVQGAASTHGKSLDRNIDPPTCCFLTWEQLPTARKKGARAPPFMLFCGEGTSALMSWHDGPGDQFRCFHARHLATAAYLRSHKRMFCDMSSLLLLIRHTPKKMIHDGSRFLNICRSPGLLLITYTNMQSPLSMDYCTRGVWTDKAQS
jgi:hypothetical protein